jgi:hypothetical protein
MIGRPLSGRGLSGRKLSGYGISTRGRGGGGASDFVPPPSIQLSGLSIAEDAEVGDLIGTLSVANSPEGVTWAFTAGEGAPSEFTLDESDDTRLEVADTLSPGTYPFPVVATSDEDPATFLNRTFNIEVTEVVIPPLSES